MAKNGGFDHNAQTLRVVTRLERRYPGFDGLNLVWETLEGLVKHNGPVANRAGAPSGPYSGKILPFAIAEYAQRQDLWLWSFAGAEAQVAAIADDIAYDAHDIDDGFRAGLLSLESLSDIELLATLIERIDREYPAIDAERRAFELIRRLIAIMIEDVISESSRRLASLLPASTDDIRQAGGPVVGFSAAMAESDRNIKTFLTANVYRHQRVMSVMERAEYVVDRLYDRYWHDAAALPEEWRSEHNGDEAGRARRIADFLAGMTDRFALAEYQRLFGSRADLGSPAWPAL